MDDPGELTLPRHKIGARWRGVPNIQLSPALTDPAASATVTIRDKECPEGALKTLTTPTEVEILDAAGWQFRIKPVDLPEIEREGEYLVEFDVADDQSVNHSVMLFFLPVIKFS